MCQLLYFTNGRSTITLKTPMGTHLAPLIWQGQTERARLSRNCFHLLYKAFLVLCVSSDMFHRQGTVTERSDSLKACLCSCGLKILFGSFPSHPLTLQHSPPTLSPIIKFQYCLQQYDINVLLCKRSNSLS